MHCILERSNIKLKDLINLTYFDIFVYFNVFVDSQ